MPSPCPCRGCDAAYKVGLEEGKGVLREARRQSYRDGYNDAMRVQAEMEWLYGPRRPVANPKRVGNMNTPTNQATAHSGPTGAE